MHPDCLPYVAASSGVGQADFERLSSVLNNIPGVQYICLDVANGYTEHFVEFVRKVRKAFPLHTIIVSEINCFLKSTQHYHSNQMILWCLRQVMLLRVKW